MACPTCGTANPVGFRFCGACAAPLDGPPSREERRTVTILFADLAGFTARSEALDPEDVRAFLVPYYDALSAEVAGHGGKIDRFLGDGVMALFGAPTAHEDDPERAVRAALRVAERVPALGLDLHLRVGINTGPVLFAPADGTRDDSVTGDAVNTAARLQVAAPVDGVVVGEATYVATSHLFRYEALAPITAKGKAEPVRLWRPLAPISRAAGDLGAETTPFVGRGFELETLVRLFERARSTPSLEVVTIVADPGIGKSRLVRELARYVDALPDLVTWRVGRCLPYGDGISFWALGEIIKAHAAILETDDQTTLSDKLDAVLTEPDPGVRTWMKDRLSPLVGLRTCTEPPRQQEAFTAWLRFLESVAAEGPTVLIIEDLHWADDALVSFLGHLAANIAGCPFLLVTTARSEVEERHPDWLGRARRSTVISLAGLAAADMATLVEATLPGASPELRATVVDRSGGSPLYAGQLAAMFRDRPLPMASDGLDQDAIPPTIAALLAARIDALPPAAKAVLVDASVIGKTFWSGAAAALGHCDRDGVEPQLTELSRRDLIRPAFPSSMAGEREYTFVHALVRDVAYGELPRSARLVRHRVAAAWITERAGASLGEDAEIVVAHLEQALELAAATGATGEVPAIEDCLVAALLVAADAALRTDVPRGVGLLRRALTLLPVEDGRRPDLLGRIGRGLRDLQAYDEAIVVLDEARRLYLAAGRDVEAALLAPWLARVHLARGDTEVGDRIFAEAGVVLDRVGGPALVTHLAYAAQRAWTLLRNEDALRLADEALSLARVLGMAPPYRALNARGAVRMDSGDLDGGQADLREAVALADAAGDFSSAMVARDNLAVSLDVYSVADALAATTEAIEVARTRGVRWSNLEVAQLGCLRALGRWDEALAGARSLDDRASSVGDAYLRVFATAYAVGIELDRGECVRDPSDLASLARSLGRAYALEALLPDAARLAARQDRASFASSLLEELLDAGVAAGHMYSGPESARAAVETGRPDLARRFLDLAVPIARRTGLADAIVAEAEGHITAARDWNAQAVGMTRTVGNVPDEAHALAGLGRCLLALGETRHGVRRLRESRQIWARLHAASRIVEIDAVLAAAGTAAASPGTQSEAGLP